MRSLIIALIAVLPLNACQDTTIGQDPPPILSSDVQALFDQYLGEGKPEVFVLSADGEHANYLYCPGFPCSKVRGVSRATILKECEERSQGVPCKVYAVGSKIVWTGPSKPAAAE